MYITNQEGSLKPDKQPPTVDEVLGQLNDQNQNKNIFEFAKELAVECKDPTERAEKLKSIADLEARTAAVAIKDPTASTEKLQSIADAQIKAKDSEKARHKYTECFHFMQ